MIILKGSNNGLIRCECGTSFVWEEKDLYPTITRHGELKSLIQCPSCGETTIMVYDGVEPIKEEIIIEKEKE